jgi:hypothetical protein
MSRLAFLAGGSRFVGGGSRKEDEEVIEEVGNKKYVKRGKEDSKG